MNDKDTVDLKPCPFCGGGNVGLYRPALGRVWHVHCDDCEIKGQGGVSREDAALHWNERTPALAAAPSKSVREEVERLRSALRAIESGECVTDWADQPHEQMQDAARAALKPSTDKGGVENARIAALIGEIEAGRFDALEAVADRWLESAGVKRMSNAIASVFEKYAPQDVMDRFREKVADLMHLAFVEGAAQGVLQLRASATPTDLPPLQDTGERDG